MKKTILIAIAMCLAGAVFAFGEVVISEFRGKVEVRTPGSAWKPAEVGMNVALDDTISTGFNSTAVLSLGSNNVIVSPLTRMSIDQFLESEEQVDTQLFLQVGAVRAQVDNSSEKRQRFSISSPYSTASVRGTVFEFDGLNLRVVDGSVALLLSPIRRRVPARNAGGQGDEDGSDDESEDGSDDGESGGGERADTDSGTVVRAGQSVQVDVDFGSGTVSATTGGNEDYTTNPTSRGSGSGGGPQSDDGGPNENKNRGGTPPKTRGTVIINWEWED